MTVKFGQSHAALLAAATLFAPLAVYAQAPSDPMATPASQSQPNQPGQTRASATSMHDNTGSPENTGQQMQDKMFIRKAAEGGLAEVALGQLAATRGASEDVKTFGQKMVTDHTVLNNNMKPIAETLGVMLPKKLNKDDQAELDKLTALSGADFDTEYLTFMVKDHHKDLREFRMEAMATSDPVLKDAVDKASTVIREHMLMVDKMARDRGISVPGRGGRPSPPPAQ